jgi:hypothetical protein
VGASHTFEANLLLSGGVNHPRVTDKATWTIGDPAIVELVPGTPGLVRALAIGTSSVTATYRGMTDTSPITVVAKCVNETGLDIVMVIDRSGSMVINEPNQDSRMENALRAAANFARNVDYTKDRVGVVSFAGRIYMPEGGRPFEDNLYVPKTSLNRSLTSNVDDVLSALQDVMGELVTTCDVANVEEVPGYDILATCNTAIGAGMHRAGEELDQNGRPEGVRKMIVLLTDGQENICIPNPDDEATALRDRGIIMVVIAAAIDLKAFSDECVAQPGGGVARTVETRMKSWTTCQLFYSAPSAEQLPDIYSDLPRDICNQLNDPESCLNYGYGFVF